MQNPRENFQTLRNARPGTREVCAGIYDVYLVVIRSAHRIKTRQSSERFVIVPRSIDVIPAKRKYDYLWTCIQNLLPLDLRRRLMAVPGPVTSDLSAGCHQIIREWEGTLVTSAAEVVEHLSPVGELLSAEPGTVVQLAGRRQAPTVFPRDLLDLESAKVLDAMPRRGGIGTVRVAQRAGLAPAATAKLLGELATGGFVERCDDGWRLRRT